MSFKASLKFRDPEIYTRSRYSPCSRRYAFWYAEMSASTLFRKASHAEITFDILRYDYAAFASTREFRIRKRNVNFPECHYQRILYREIREISTSLRVVSNSPNPHDCVAKRQNACVIQWSPKQLSLGTNVSKLSSCSVVRVITLGLDISYILARASCDSRISIIPRALKGIHFAASLQTRPSFLHAYSAASVFSLATFYKNNFAFFDHFFVRHLSLFGSFVLTRLQQELWNLQRI